VLAKILRSLTFALAALCLITSSAYAMSVRLSPVSAGTAGSGMPRDAPADNVCVVLVLDESGSMRDNDPTFLRNTGAKLFVALLDDGDRVGIVRFASGATRLTPDPITLNTAQDKQDLLGLLGDSPPEGYTDIHAALNEAAALLKGAQCGARHIVLLSDGQPELPDGLPADYESKTLDLVRDLNAPILGIALTSSGESGLLYRLAAVTDPPGAVIPARTATDLLDAYLDAVARLKDRAVLGSGLTGAPGFASLPLEPGLAQYVSRATYIVSKPEDVSVTFTAPGGEPLAPEDPHVSFAFTDDPRFAVYTVDAPAPGDWGFALAGSGSAQARAILRSRLRIAVGAPGTYHPLDEPLSLSVSLIEEGRDGTVTTLIGEAVFSALIVRPDGAQDAIDRLYDDGTHGDLLASDGIFTNLYVRAGAPGEYRITVTGYKGVIPVTRTVRVIVVPFPRIVILSPSEPSFEFRGEPLPLAMRLEGGEPPSLDTGTFIVRVTHRDGTATAIPLVSSEGGFIGTFAPARDGKHVIEFLPQEAAYKGVPYSLTARRTVDVRLIPAITLVETDLNLGTLEVGEIAAGVTAQIRITSSSPQAEALTFDLVGAPGLAIDRVSPAQIPGGESTVHLTFKGDLSPGDYSTMLLVSGRSGVEFLRREVPITFTVYEPSLTVQPAALDLGSIRVERVNEKQVASVLVTSNSLRDEPFDATWIGPEGVHVQAETAAIPAGQAVEIPLSIWAEDLSEGDYSGEIHLASRDGVILSPSVIEVSFSVVSPTWCERWCLPVAGAGVALLVAGMVAAGYLSGRPKPWGVLEPIKVPAGQIRLPSIFLASAAGLIHPERVVIGSGKGANVRLTGGAVRAKHAAIHIARQPVTERVGRPPRPVRILKSVSVVENLGDGVVKVNNVTIPRGRRSAPLRSGARVIIGEYEFEYRE